MLRQSTINDAKCNRKVPAFGIALFTARSVDKEVKAKTTSDDKSALN